jgi:uncharacterized protein (DUF1778 family)
MIDTTSTAAVLYGSAEASADIPASPGATTLPLAAEVQSPAGDEQAVADDAAKGEKPVEPHPWTRTPEELLTDSFYDPRMTHKPATNEIESAFLERGVTAEEVKAIVDEWWPVLARYGVENSSDVARAVAATAREMPTAEKVDDWGRASTQYLLDEFGAEAENVLADMRKIVADDPRAKRFLELTGLGNHPSVVEALAKSATAFRKAGKLK